MLRIVMYRLDADGQWIEGVLHTFNDGHAVIENRGTGELELVPVKKTHLKFSVLMEQWIKMQQEAQMAAQAQAQRSAISAPNIATIRR